MLHSVRVLDTQYHKVEQVLDIYYTLQPEKDITSGKNLGQYLLWRVGRVSKSPSVPFQITYKYGPGLDHNSLF